VRVRLPSSQVVTVVNDATPTAGSAATAALVSLYADRSIEERRSAMQPHLYGRISGSVLFPREKSTLPLIRPYK